MRHSLFSSLLLGAAALTPVHMASAQDVEESAARGPSAFPGDIIVTAQRRAERVQDIPVAISAFGGEQVQKMGILSLDNIAPRVPSFYFGSFGAARPQLYIRGIGTRAFDPGSESSVGVFVDDVYAGRASGSFGALRDIERIEVLRGPQGTLYGRNTIAGAINVISKGPTDHFTANAEAGISNYGGWDLFAGVGGPIVDDRLMFRLAGWKTERKGYQRNLTTGNRFQGLDNWGGRARLKFAPTDNFTIDLTAEIARDGDKAAFSGYNRGSGPALSLGGVLTPPNPESVFIVRPGAVPIPYHGGLDGHLSSDPFLDRKIETYIGRLEFDAGFATLTSISAFKKLRISDGRSLEGSSLAVIDQASREHSKQFTQEFRITSNPDGGASFGGALDWIIGGFYYRDRSDREDIFSLGPDSVIALLSGGPQISTSLADYRIDSYAVFGQATLHLGEQFELTLGGRYTHDKKQATMEGRNTYPGVPLIAVPFITDNSASYNSFDPRIVATYKINPDVSVYASYSTGFKSGGFQYAAFSAADANTLFAPEDIKTYEIGLKSEWLDRRLRLNISGFHYDYKNLQVHRIVDFGGGAASNLISNAASTKIYGVDTEVVLHPSDNIELSVAYGFLDAKYDKYTTNPAGTLPTPNSDFSGRHLVRAPTHTISVGGEWRIPVSDDSGLTLRADYSLLSTFYHDPGDGQAIYGGAASLATEPSYGLLNLRATYEIGNAYITGYINNVTGEKYRRTVLTLGSTLSDFPGEPRIYGLKVGYNF